MERSTRTWLGAVETDLGRLWVVATSLGVASVGLPCRSIDELAADLVRRGLTPPSRLDPEGGGPSSSIRERLRRAREELAAYASGRGGEPGLELDLRGTTGFQRAVWRATRAIPAGEVRTYGDIASAIGRPGAARAVGGALNRNPVPIVVPCHRVVARDGLGGFGAGVDWKRRLLDLDRQGSRGDRAVEPGPSR